MGLGLYNVENPMNKVMSGYQGASSSLSAMTKKIETPDPNAKTAGGAVSAGLGGVAATAGIYAAMGSTMGPVGVGIGAAAGLLSYLL